MPSEHIGGVMDMVRCGACGTVQVETLPSPETLRDFYGRIYLDNYQAGMSAERFVREMPLRHAAKLRLVGKYVPPPGRLIDVGCGEGFFLAQATQAGWDAEGVDYSLRSSYPAGVRVSVGTLDEPGGLPSADQTADVVTCWAVIEHVRDPHQALREIFRILKPGGYLFLDTPLCGDLSERLVQGKSHWFTPPEHLHVFSAPSLRRVVEGGGFCVVRQSPFFERSIPRWWARRGRNVAVGVVAGGLGRLLRPSRWRADRQRRVTQIGDIQLLVARKV